MAIITLTTDHGLKDFYVSAIKGVILSEIPDATIVDISHEVPMFDITQAAFILRNAYIEFPKGSIHIIGVMPDASDKHSHVAIKYDGQYFIGADNGIFSLMFDNLPEQIVELNIKNDSAFIKPTKDIFTKAACHIARGGALEVIGKSKPAFLQKATYRPVVDRNLIIGSVIYIDHYGNAITNITEPLFREIGKRKSFQILFRNSVYSIEKISLSYNDVFPGDSMAIFGPTNFLEIAINVGNANQLLGLNLSDSIRIEFEE